ncbi:cob(I)yrinic acid a,c-diamide adenosyltransferase [Anaerocolumna sedimenticola]|uniref:Cob(I)yrinic acid a,c-diamide adenosyltransferase n=1 Tax=Anaerocolumna sedimenticola TaxID=2696063 RepID=A0A6P1TMY9_9FIRM|nr:cob(I)yrinic acid a,c-diamide adenosyltransferase [Anaerocolumna sedimenticola]QHQ61261.1 cob(I)yrinic acid a,c-diamide adenosyltransferase [Anaerocolumna sedimenticola]
MNQGLIHVYCGDGKGKTTAAIGLAIRAAGSGMRVVLLQFLKGRLVSELESLKLIPGITVIRNDKDFGFYHTMSSQDKMDITAYHNENLRKALDMVEDNSCDLLILDEIMAAYKYQLVDCQVIDNLLQNKKKELELVLTGRDPAPLFLEKADYISEIKKIKHPYDKNITARKGIEL